LNPLRTAENTTVDDTRTHHTAIARQYLVLAEDEILNCLRGPYR
jgi:hypothetical protein